MAFDTAPTEHVPYRCPVCKGRGMMPTAFYLMPGGTTGTSDTGEESCHSCHGTGLVWRGQPVEYVVPQTTG